MEKALCRGRRRAPAFRILPLCAIGLAALSAVVPARAAEGRGPQTPADVVTALYQITEGARTRCRHAPPETAAAYDQALSRFEARHPRVITLTRNSPLHAKAQRDFARNAGYDPSRDTPQSLVPECEVQANLLRVMVDTDRGRGEVKRFEAILSK